IRQEDVLDVVGMVDHVVVHATPGSENAVDVAVAREIFAQPRQRFFIPAEVEALRGTRWKGRSLHRPHCIVTGTAQNGPAQRLARRNALPDNGAVPKKPAGGLRNTIYEQQTRSSRRL